MLMRHLEVMNILLRVMCILLGVMYILLGVMNILLRVMNILRRHMRVMNINLLALVANGHAQKEPVNNKRTCKALDEALDGNISIIHEGIKPTLEALGGNTQEEPVGNKRTCEALDEALDGYNYYLITHEGTESTPEAPGGNRTAQQRPQLSPPTWRTLGRATWQTGHGHSLPQKCLWRWTC